MRIVVAKRRGCINEESVDCIRRGARGNAPIFPKFTVDVICIQLDFGRVLTAFER